MKRPNPRLAGPAVATPARLPGSLRRTSTIDTTWDGDLGGDLRHRGVARDVATAADGSAAERASARLEVRAASGSRRVLELSTDPPVPALAALVGASLATGFRGRMRPLVPDEEAAATPLYLLLDDLAGASLVSGYALLRAGRAGGLPSSVTAPRREHPPVDICAGWASDASMMVALRENGTQPVPYGPAAPDVTGTDPDGWHAADPLPPFSMRRARRLDVAPGAGGYAVDAFFRDSHVDAGGVETVVHEYSLRAEVAPDGATITAAEAAAGALPWSECPAALASARRLVGLRVGELRRRVHREFTGRTTCTHLNDVMRSLSDLDALIPALG